MVRLKPLIASEFVQLDKDIQELLINSGAVPVNAPFFDLWDDNSDMWILNGGFGSGKSIFVCDYLLKQSLNLPYFKCLYGRKVYNSVRGSVYDNFIKRIKFLKLTNKFEYSESPNGSLYIKCKENGNIFHPFGADNADSLLSFSDPTHVFCDEFDQFDQTDFAVLYSRLRMEGVQLQFIGAFNREKVHPEHWIKKYFFDKHEEAELKTKSKIKQVFCNYTDNLFVIHEDYEARLWLAAGYDEKKFLQMAKGEWGSLDTSNLFAWAYSNEKHKVDVLKSEGATLMQIDRRLPVHLAFDFNCDPMTCLVTQFYKMDWLKVIDELRLRNSDIFELTERIKTLYGEYHLIATGDASGRNRDGNSKGGRSYVMNIKTELKLSDGRVQFPAKNPFVKDSRMVLNGILKKHPKIFISSKCHYLIDDLNTVTTDGKGGIDKDKDETKTHLIDGFRYLLWNYFRGYLNIKF